LDREERALPRDVADWLEALGLGKYAARFAENEIDFEVLPDLSEDDLRDLDIPLGPRKKLLKAIAALRGGGASASDAAPEASPDTAREVEATTRETARADEREPPRRIDGERRQLTVMFCDLVDSTALSARMDPEDLRDVIRGYHVACAKAVERFGGYVAKYLGDGILAYFGYPQAHEKDAERAARAGLAVVDAVAALSATDARPCAPALAVRVGIDTGLVVVGDLIAEGTAEAASVVGETPNIAARLQSLAAPNQVVVGPLTRDLVGDAFVCEDLGTHALKGIPAPLRAWRIVGERERGAGHVGATRQGAALVGRREELGLLVRAWEASRRGQGQVVLLQGEPGIGKSRLVDALRAAAAPGEHTWVATRCSPYHTSSSLHPVIEHVKRLIGWNADDDPKARLSRLESVLRGQSLPLERAVPLYAALMSLPLGDSGYPPLRLTAEEQRAQTLDALAAWLLEEADRKPVLRVWEDVQWADSTTLALLGLCIAQAPTSAMLNVVTYRPEFTPPWPMRSHMTLITLNRLERADVEALIVALAGGKPMPPEVFDFVADKTDGVPLYVEELTKGVLDARFVEEREGRYALVRPLSDVAIPATLQDMLMARLDRLPTIREVAQLGSILGREFAYEMLQAIGSLREGELQDGLDRLVDAELLYERGRRPRARYIFKHALVQDAAYQSLLRRTRQYYHRQVAELLESRYPDVVSGQPELVAHHYARAELHAKAVHYLTLCATHASALDAHADAIAALEQARALALHLPDGERDRVAVTLAIREAQSLHFAGRRREIVELLVAHRDRLARLADDALSCEFDFWLGFAHSWLGHRAEATECLQRGLASARASGADAIAGRILRALATECVYSGRPLAEAIGFAREAAAALERQPDGLWPGQALFTLSYCCIFAGDFDAALDAARQLEAWAQAAGSKRAHANAAMLTGLALALRGDGPAAIDACERALRASPDRFETAFILACLGRAHLGANDGARAAALLQEAVDLADQVRSLQFRAWFRTMFAEACLAQGEIERADAALRAALATSVDAHFPLGIALAQQAMGRVAATLGDRVAAAQRFGEAIDTFAALGARFELARAQMERARVACADDPETARHDLAQARAGFEALNIPSYVEQSDRLGERLGTA
jgi:class 3 adenylate cyclase/tetratricopeptide (TPR) repeat protein